ncbi:MAG: hypothetical protein IJS99_09980 [Synergistaceae bacterium]|nr:hypothetical protein [Synergistaceae bacterium]
MKKRIFSLFFVLCFMLTCSAAWAKLPNALCILESDTEGKAADGYEYTSVVNGTTELPDDFNGITLGYGNSNGALAACYISIGAAAIANNQPLQTADYSLGNGLTVSVTQTDANHAVLKITGTPNKVGSVSFVVTRSSQTGTVKNTASATLKVKVTNAPSTSAPTISNPTMPQVVHGRAFSATITATDNYDVDEGEYVNISIVDPDEIENDDDSVVYLSSEELSGTYGITAEMSGDSTLVLAADKVASPTPIDKTVKFRVSTYNDYTKTEEYAEAHDGSTVVTRDFTLKFTAIAPKIESVHVASIDAKKLSGTDLGTYPITIEDSETEDESVKGEKIKKKADEETPAVRIYFKTNKTTAIPEAEESEEILKIDTIPAGLTFTLDETNTTVSDNLTVKITEFVYVLEGNPTESGTFNITVTPSNTVYNVKNNGTKYTLTVLAAPSIKSPTLEKGLTAMTFGKTYSGTSITLDGGNKSHPASILKAEVMGDDGNTSLPSFLSISSNKLTGTFNTYAHVSALKTALGADDDVVDGFGDNESVTLNLEFTLSCDVFPADTIPTVSRSITISTVKPAFENTSKNQKSAQTKIDNAKLAAGSAITATIELEASAPGNIVWSYDKLPNGIELVDASDEDNTADTETKTLTPTKSSLKSTVKITGTPSAPAKSYSTTIRAHNGAGHTDVKLTFNISAPTPVIAYKVKSGNDYVEYDEDEGTPFSGDLKVGDTLDILVYNADPNSGATKFSAKGLPGGITLKMSGDREAKISGTFTKSATNSTVEITAQDQDSSAKPSATAKLTGVNVYAVPTIKTSKLNDLTIGKFDTVTVTGEGAQEWRVSLPSVEAYDNAAEIDGETTLTGHTAITSADAVTNTKGVLELKLGRKIEVAAGEQTVRVWAHNVAGTVSKDLTFKIKGDKVKITTSKIDKLTTAEGSVTIEATGSPTIEWAAYIKASDAKAAGFNNGEQIDLNKNSAEDVTGFGLKMGSDSGENITITKIADTPLHKGIKVTVSADNGLGAATKTYTIVVDGISPVWLSGDIDSDSAVDVSGKTLGSGTKGKSEVEQTLITYNLDENKANFVDLNVSGDLPLEITYGTLPGGISVAITSSEANPNPNVKISYTAANNSNKKPGSNKIAFTAKNTATGKSEKVNVQLTAQQKPNIGNKTTLAAGKTIQTGKKLSLKGTLDPADKTATWAISSGDIPLGIELNADEIKSIFGITMDPVKGTLTGTPEKVTSKDTGGADFMNIWINVSNDAGEDNALVKVKITGSKPKLDSSTKQFTLTRDLDVTAAASKVMSEDLRTIKAQGIASLDMKMTLDTAENTKLKALGSSMAISTNGVITGTPDKGTKGQTIKVSADHFGATAYLSVKIIVLDPIALLSPDSGLTVPVTITGELNDKYKVNEAVTVENIKLVLDKEATDVPTWKIVTKPDSRVTLKITEKAKDSVTLSATLKKNAMPMKSDGKYLSKIHTSFKVSATNKSNKHVSMSDPISIDIVFTGADDLVDPDDEDPDTEEDKIDEETAELHETDKKTDELVEEELTKELGEGDLSIGAERTDSALTDEQKAAIKAEGYMIAAILPEISATVDGQYGLEVDLLADVPAGSELKWLAYPQSPAAPSEDDEIADFFDIDGADTTTVPADHIVLVYPWLREGVKYAPVIVAKVSEAAPGDVVSEEGLDEAVEKAKEGEESTEEIVLDEEGKTTEAPAENQETTTETPAEEEPANDESKPEETSTEAQSE